MPKDSRDVVIEGLLRRLSHMQQILNVSRSLNATLDLRRLLQYITETATDLTRTEASSIMLLDAKTGQLRFAASCGIRQNELLDLTVPLEDSIAGMILSAGKPVVINDVQRDPRFFQEIDARCDFYSRSILGVPLEVNSRKIGVLEVVNKRDDEPFTDDDTEVLTILGAQAAVSIENARLFEQSDAISDVVHELRTPLTSIIGYSKMFLMTDNLSPAMQRQFAATIHREATRLGDMVNGYLDLARMASGRSRLKLVETDLARLIGDVTQLMQPQASERQIQIETDISAPIKPQIVDPERLRQVLINLTSNAIKYNRPAGKITLGLHQTLDGETRIFVRDTGNGISPENLPHIFDKFFRVEDQESQAKGTGLGLAIVKQIVEMHGGTINAQSTLGEGTTFTVSLPAQAIG